MLSSDAFLVVLKKGEKTCSYSTMLFWHENNFPRKKLPLLREAMCDNYFIVTWSVLNHMDGMGQTRGLNSLVKFEALGTSLRTVSLFYDFKRYIKSSCKIYF